MFTDLFSKRTALDVAVDLSEAFEESDRIDGDRIQRGERKKEQKVEELIHAGLLTRSERASFQRDLNQKPLIIAVAIGLIALLVSQFNPLFSLAGFSLGLSGGYLYSRNKLYQKQQKYLRDIDYYLPVVMERLVMAVQAGLDVFSSLRALVEIEQDDIEKGDLREQNLSSSDPVSRLLERVYRLTERGVAFEEALKQVANEVPSPSLRHAFVHLSVAQKEGGELILPLRELSDSTQNYFQ